MLCVFRYSVALAVVILLCAATTAPAFAADNNVPTISIDDMLAILRSPQKSKPLVLHVGPHMLYQQAHIPGSEYAGAGSNPEGIERIRRRVAYLDKKKMIILYCGCCPWNHCPNVNPAYDTLKQLGFTNVKVLYIPTNFGMDWVEKGHPVEKGD